MDSGFFLLNVLILSRLVAGYWQYQSLNVTQWQWQSSVVVDNWLYIDGGELYAIENGKSTFFYLGQTVSIDLTQPWTNATVQDYSRETQRSTSDGHWSKKPALFYDQSKNVVVQWGGWPYNNGDKAYEFVFTPNANGTANWIQSVPPVTNAVNQTSPAIFAAANVVANGSFYSLGGVVAEQSAPPDLAVQGLLEYNFSGNNWTNTSSANASANGLLVGAEAAFTPGSNQGGFGSAGYLVFIGGNVPQTQIFDPATVSLVDMSNITLYNIDSQSWYHQTTTGTIPPPRQYFCSVAATSIQATFEIFILGGSTNGTYDQAHPNDTDYLNVYTLSIPAFRWFKSSASDSVRRADHACQLIGNKQMLVIGGTQPSSSSGIAAVDPWPNGLGIFDMSNFTWADSYDPQAPPYQQPNVVRDYYSNQYQAPIWGDPQLQSDFAWEPPDLPTGTYSGYYPSATSSSTATTSSSPASSSATKHKGAIIGGVVGGVGGLILAVIAVTLLLRKWRPRQAATAEPTSQPGPHDSAVYPKAELESPFSSPTIGRGSPMSDEGSDWRGSMAKVVHADNAEVQELDAGRFRSSRLYELPSQ